MELNRIARCVSKQTGKEWGLMLPVHALTSTKIGPVRPSWLKRFDIEV